MVTLTTDMVRDALLAWLRSDDDTPMKSVVAESDCYLAGSYSYGRADAASDLDILAFTETEWQVEGILAPFGQGGPRPGPGESLPSMADVLHWRATAGLSIVEIEVLGPEGRRVRELDIATWTFILQHARPLSNGWGGGEQYLESVTSRFERLRPSLAMASLIEFQRNRNQAQTSMLHEQPIAVAMAAAMTVRAALRAWMLWQGRAVPPDKWLSAVVEEHNGSGELLGFARRLLDVDRAVKDRFKDARDLRDLLSEHVRSLGGDPKPLWVWPPSPQQQMDAASLGWDAGAGGHVLPVPVPAPTRSDSHSATSSPAPT